MVELDGKREFEFYSRLLDLCKEFNVGVDCSDPYETIDIIPFTDEFEREFRFIYLGDERQYVS